MEEAVLILIKPDGLKKSLTGNILTRLSETKLEIMAAKMARVSTELAQEHYRHLKDKPFFAEIVKYLRGDLHNRRKVMALVYWGEDAINKCRSIAGATNPEEADPTSIRGSYGRITTKGVLERHPRLLEQGRGRAGDKIVVSARGDHRRSVPDEGRHRRKKESAHMGVTND
jgi:nucleoside-diphosphate kinase